MSILGGKVVGVVAAVLFTAGVGAATYTGGGLVSDIKTNITTLEDKAQLYHDQTYSETKISNSVITDKNAEIQRLEGEIDRLNSEVQKGNNEDSRAKTELDKANVAIGQANTDMTDVKSASDSSVAAVNALPALGGVTDGKDQIVGKPLDIALVVSQSHRTVKLVNYNTIAVDVSYNGETVTVPAGGVKYVTDTDSTTTFTYSPGNGVSTSVTK